jgi:hypothetical protein
MRPARADDFRLPDLRFVAVEDLVPHEQFDLQRLTPLAQRLREQAVLKNPPIVTTLAPDAGDRRYMVLDGANRSTAARVAGLPHIVVQVVHYEEPWVVLRTWHHALSQVAFAAFAEACRRIPELECRDEPLLTARAQLARREALAFAVHDAQAALVFRGAGGLEQRNRLLNAIVDLYRDQHRFYRMSTDSLEVARERHPDVTTLIVFPAFAPAEVLELANSGAKLPAGITRHLIRWRALRIHVPLERLADTGCSLEAKNAWLRQWLQEKFDRRQVRFYEEPTVLFDE